MERWGHKVIATLTLFALLAFFILLPLKISQVVRAMGKRGQVIIHVITCFGGGVFFGAFLLHVGPDSRALLTETLLQPYGITYPVAELLTAGGFFMILFFEKFIVRYQSRKSKALRRVRDDVIKSASDIIGNGVGPPAYVTCDVINRTVAPPAYVNGAMELEVGLPSVDSGIAKADSGVAKADSGVAKADAGVAKDDGNVRSARIIVFIVALSLDSIFEGLSMGLKLSVVGVWSLFLAIIGHEFVVAFSLGLELVRTLPRRRAVIVGLAYASMVVIGAVIGIVIIEVGVPGNPLITDRIGAVLQCLCAGTYVYCAFLGILGEEMVEGPHITKAVGVLAGFTLMALVGLIPDVEEETVREYIDALANNSSIARH